VAGQQREAAGISIEAGGLLGADAIDICIHHRVGHVEGVKNVLIEQGVAPPAEPVVGREFDGRAPEEQFGVARLNPPPLAGAPARRPIGRLAESVEVEFERFAAGATGVVELRAAARATEPGHLMEVFADVIAAQQRQGIQRIETESGIGRVDTGLADAFRVERAMIGGRSQKPAHLALLEGAHDLGRQMLGAIQLGQAAHGVAATEPLGERPEDVPGKPAVHGRASAV